MDNLQFNKYVIDSKLGHGGMGVVYSAHSIDESDIDLSTSLPQKVALKTLTVHSEMPDERAQEIQRFDKEITALRMLDHPNIVHILGFGVQGEQMYYVMELVPGKSLQEVLKSGQRFSWGQTLEIAKQLASAISSAHIRGIIHRDIKPGNILILNPESEKPVVKLTDFGIARVFSSQPITDIGNVIGTLQYMAPEQANGQPVSVQADLYSIGAVLYTLMAGHAPFLGRTTVEMQRLHAGEPLQPLVRDGVDLPIPVEFQNILTQLLAIKPAQRIQTALALSRRLDAIEIVDDSTISVTDSPLPDEQADIIGLPSQSTPPTKLKNTFVKVEHNVVNEPESHFSWIPVLFWVFILTGFVTGLLYFLRPLTADQLYKRINETRILQRDSAFTDMNTFLQKFSDDARCATILSWRESSDVDKLQRRIQSRLNGTGSWGPSTILERQYFKAWQISETSTEDALREFEAIANFYQIPPYTADMGRHKYDQRICLLSVQKMIDQMQARQEEDLKPLRESVIQRLAEATTLMETDPGQAEKIAQSIVLLYCDVDNLSDLVEQARRIIKKP